MYTVFFIHGYNFISTFQLFCICENWGPHQRLFSESDCWPSGDSTERCRTGQNDCILHSSASCHRWWREKLGEGRRKNSDLFPAEKQVLDAQMMRALGTITQYLRKVFALAFSPGSGESWYFPTQGDFIWPQVTFTAKKESRKLHMCGAIACHLEKTIFNVLCINWQTLYHLENLIYVIISFPCHWSGSETGPWGQRFTHR